jgi:subtilase family serine protease
MLLRLTPSRLHLVVAFTAAVAWVAAPSAQAQATTVGTVPPVIQRANNLGAISPDEEMHVTVWLRMRNEAEFEKSLQAIYTPGSPTYHKWMQTSDLQTYAPAATDRKLVMDELNKLGLANEDGGDGFTIRVHGPAATLQRAFKTQINTFELNGRRFHANISEAQLEGEAGKLVRGVTGLSSYGPHPFIAHRTDPKTGAVLPPVAMSKVKAAGGGLSGFFTGNCFGPPTAYAFGTAGQFPFGVFYGQVYSPNGAVCGYLPSQVQSIYGLNAAYQAGIAGQGQTIVIVVAYGSSTILNDANAFSALTGLPALNSSNFKVIYPDGQPPNPALGIQLGWNSETAIDVEWTHAIAPAAKIVLLVAPSQDDNDLQSTILYATLHQFGSVVSNSYGKAEIGEQADSLDIYNLLNQLAAATGISMNFASGDNGDEALGTPVGAVSSPADSPYATAVGGTSFSVPNGVGGNGEVGWGNNLTVVAVDPADVTNPPVNLGNNDGSGGGQSTHFTKPVWQRKLPGNARLVPDVAALADPHTGAVFVYTNQFSGLVAESIGGTSLSCPIFSGFWALANQKAGHRLGQAAPIIAALAGTGALHDIVPISSPSNVVGTIIDTNGAQFYSAADLAAPLEGTTKFVSAFWQIGTEFVDLTFGTDTSLHTAAGWDNVTGFGTPVGLTFINAAAKY